MTTRTEERESPFVTVILPTYRRPEQFARCLLGIAAQTVPPVATIVVHRSDDEATKSHLAYAMFPLAFEVITVSGPGVLAAMAAGLEAARTPYVAFVDDDAVPRPDWIERMLGPFQDPNVGGVGGRDVIGGSAGTEDPPLTSSVGLLSAFGRLTGNHHLGLGPLRDVDVLKAVNCCYRRSAIAIPRTLRGSGAQAHFEVGIGLRAKSEGWRLVYDPSILVDHFPGPRFDGDTRSKPSKAAVFDAAYNLTFAIGSFGHGRAIRRTVFAIVVGDRALPGVIRAAVALVTGKDRAAIFSRLTSALRGNAWAAVQLAVGRRLAFYDK